MGPEVRLRKIGMFLALTFTISWTSAGILYFSEIEIGSLVGLITITALFMWAPGLAAIVTQRWYGESVLEFFGFSQVRSLWVLLAWVTPVALLILTVWLGSILPNVVFTTDFGAYLLDFGLPEAQVEEIMAQLEAFPVFLLPILFTIQGLFAGISINALAALGEELGWRGLCKY